MRCLFLAAVVVATLSGSVPSTAAQGVLFRPPTEAPVVDPFRLPFGPYGPGNRGIEYATGPAQVVVAAAPGSVVFSGAVAGSLFVTIDHGGSLKSTYGFVAHLMVSRGDYVQAGAQVAYTDGPFHFSVRLDGVYIDPETVFGRRNTRVRLVASESPRRIEALSVPIAERAVLLSWRSNRQERDRHQVGVDLGGGPRRQARYTSRRL